MCGDLGRVEVNEAADLVVRDAAELGPVAERADRGLFAGRENAAGAESDNVDELRVDVSSRIGGRVHAAAAVSTHGHEKARTGEGAGGLKRRVPPQGMPLQREPPPRAWV